jgi:hypothetical protein
MRLGVRMIKRVERPPRIPAELSSQPVSNVRPNPKDEPIDGSGHDQLVWGIYGP